VVSKPASWRHIGNDSRFRGSRVARQPAANDCRRPCHRGGASALPTEL